MDIKVDHISKAYGEQQVLQDLSCVFPEGKTTCIRGRSGCGKTTLIRLLLRLDIPDKGKIEGVSDRKLSAVFQEDRLCENLSAASNIRLVCTETITDRELEEAYKAVALTEIWQKPVRELSGGMRRRVSILRALLAESDCVIMDEPLRGLDEKTRAKTIDYILKKTEGKTLIFVTHEEKEAVWLKADRTVDNIDKALKLMKNPNWYLSFCFFGYIIIHLKPGEDQETASIRYLYEIANVLPGFLEERGFTVESAYGVKKSTSSLLNEDVKMYYRDYICGTSGEGYQSLHITVYDNSSRSFMEVQLRTQKMDDTAEIGPANHLGYEKKQQDERARRDAIPEGECVYFDEAYERGMRLLQLELADLDVNMFSAVDNSLINDGCGLFRGRLILPYEHLSRFQNDVID